MRSCPKTKNILKYYKLYGGTVRGNTKNERLINAAMSISPDFRVPAKIVRRSAIGAATAQLGKSKSRAKSFYQSVEWKRIRYDVLKANDGRCELCGVSKHDGAKLNVDHIKSFRDHWDLRLDPKNLQVLCGSCNCGKGNRDATDWREPSLRVLMGEAMG